MKTHWYKTRTYNPIHKAYYNYMYSVKPCKSYDEFKKVIYDFGEFLGKYLSSGCIISLPYNCGHLFFGSVKCGKVKDKINSKKLGYDVYVDLSNTNGEIAKMMYVPTFEFKGPYSKDNILAKCWKFKSSKSLRYVVGKKFSENHESFIPLYNKKQQFFKEYNITKTYNEFE